jgi:hypothetical protein
MDFPAEIWCRAHPLWDGRSLYKDEGLRGALYWLHRETVSRFFLGLTLGSRQITWAGQVTHTRPTVTLLPVARPYQERIQFRRIC